MQSRHKSVLFVQAKLTKHTWYQWTLQVCIAIKGKTIIPGNPYDRVEENYKDLVFGSHYINNTKHSLTYNIANQIRLLLYTEQMFEQWWREKKNLVFNRENPSSRSRLSVQLSAMAKSGNGASGKVEERERESSIIIFEVQTKAVKMQTVEVEQQPQQC